jgi:hypothetical protein
VASQEVLDAVHAIMNHVAVVKSAADYLGPHVVAAEGASVLQDLKGAAERLVVSATHLRALVQAPGGGRSLTPPGSSSAPDS